MLLNKRIFRLIFALLGMMFVSAAVFAQTSQEALIQRYLEKAEAEFGKPFKKLTKKQNLMTEILKVRTRILTQHLISVLQMTV